MSVNKKVEICVGTSYFRVIYYDDRVIKRERELAP